MRILWKGQGEAVGSCRNTKRDELASEYGALGQRRSLRISAWARADPRRIFGGGGRCGCAALLLFFLQRFYVVGQIRNAHVDDGLILAADRLE